MRINKKSEDNILIRSYIEGNDFAFEILLTRHKDRIFSYLISLVKNRKIAEDIFQDAFFKIIKTLKKGSYNEEGKFLPWAMRISHNLAIDYFRKKKKMQTVSESSFRGKDNEDFDIFSVINTQEASIEDEMIETQIHENVRNLLDHLPEDQKEVVFMRHFKGMSFKDIAETKNISINTALGRMRYALINLRKVAEERKVDLTIF